MGVTPIPEDLASPHWALAHRMSARRDFRFHAMLFVGLVFVYAGSVVDPAENCSSDGECAPWLVPIAFWMGVFAAVCGAAALVANPRRGSAINTLSGELVWWNGSHPAASGRLKLADVAVIRVDERSDTSTVRLVDATGASLKFGGTEVVSWRLEKWARAVQALYPHIQVDVAA